MKAGSSLEKHNNSQKTEDGQNLFFKELANKFWLISNSFSWSNKVVHGRPSFKRTS